MSDNIWADIAAPLNPKQIKTREQGGTKIAYIDRADVINRLNAVCPADWHFEVTVISIDPWVVKGRLTIAGVVREDFGRPANPKNFDPPKAAVSDALKRCASQFGFAIELYGEDYEETAPPAPHWTETQNWGAFWGYVHNDLALTDEEAHAALGVDSVKDFEGTKAEAMALLNNYAGRE